MNITISELQKNINILQNLETTVKVVDNKTKKVLVVILPNREYNKESLTNSLAGSLKGKSKVEVDNLESAIKKAYQEEISK